MGGEIVVMLWVSELKAVLCIEIHMKYTTKWISKRQARHMFVSFGYDANEIAQTASKIEKEFIWCWHWNLDKFDIV